MVKDVPGYESLYGVDELGNVYSLIHQRSKILKPHEKNGYLAVNLFKNGKCRHKYVHRLVAEAFVDNPYSFPVVNHIDANKHNNRAENLEWCTQLRNIEHSWEKGLQKGVGENHPMAKLTVEQVKEIRREYVKGSRDFGTSALSKKFGVAQCTISAIVNGRIWREVMPNG